MTVTGHRTDTWPSSRERCHPRNNQHPARPPPLSPAGRVAIAKAIEDREKPKAKARQEATRTKPGDRLRSGETPSRSNGGGILPPPKAEPQKVRDVAAAAVGMSPHTYERAREVVEAGEQEGNRMTRRRLLLSLVLLLLAGGVLSLPAVHWRLIGWWRGEAFFQDRPTSWWEQEIEHNFYVLPAFTSEFDDRWYVHQAPPSVLESLNGWLSGGFPYKPSRQASLTEGDPQALSVLLELIRSDKQEARWVAVSGLGPMARDAPELLPALMAAARDDGDEEVRLAAIREVRRIDPQAAVRAGLVVP